LLSGQNIETTQLYWGTMYLGDVRCKKQPSSLAGKREKRIDEAVHGTSVCKNGHEDKEMKEGHYEREEEEIGLERAYSVMACLIYGTSQPNRGSGKSGEVG
jgi:hypothetical protein